MKIAIVDESRAEAVTRDSLLAIATAIQTQLYSHVAPAWQSDGCVVYVAESLRSVERGDSPLVVFDDPDQAGVLGYHSVTPTGLAYGKAFWSVVTSLGGGLSSGADSLAVTLSHEAIEMFVDPYASFWADLPDGATEEALEACDRVESDSYEIEGVSVSNFLRPRAFRDGDGPYDWMEVLKSPWEIRPGGYAIRRVGGPGGDTRSVFGVEYPLVKRDVKLSHGRALLARSGSRRRPTVPAPPSAQ